MATEPSEVRVDEITLAGKRLSDRTVGVVSWVSEREGGGGIRVFRGANSTQAACQEKFFFATGSFADAVVGDAVTFEKVNGEMGVQNLRRIGITRKSFVAQVRWLESAAMGLFVDNAEQYLSLNVPAPSQSISKHDFVTFNCANGHITGITHLCKGVPDIDSRGQCPVCMEERVPLTSMCQSHATCVACFQRYIRVQHADQASYPLKCWVPTCGALLGIDKVRQVVTDTEFERIERFTASAALQDMAATCTNCGHVQFIRRRQNSGAGRCQQCSTVFCARCGVCEESHLTQSCEAYQRAARAARARVDAELFEQARQQFGWQRCPACGIPVEKTGGCMHMKHVRCPRTPDGRGTVHFCYSCGEQLEANGRRTLDGRDHVPHTFGPCGRGR